MLFSTNLKASCDQFESTLYKTGHRNFRFQVFVSCSAHHLPVVGLRDCTQDMEQKLVWVAFNANLVKTKWYS